MESVQIVYLPYVKLGALPLGFPGYFKIAPFLVGPVAGAFAVFVDAFAFPFPFAFAFAFAFGPAAALAVGPARAFMMDSDISSIVLGTAVLASFPVSA